MEKIIWLIEDKREEILDLQRKINAHGGMKAMCILNIATLKRIIDERISGDTESLGRPSLIIIDYDMLVREKAILQLLKTNEKLAGVPVFITTDKLKSDIEEECYGKGAMLVLEKPVNKNGILRIEQTSWQYEMSKTYESVLQRQNSEIESSKEIKKLNQQLKNRNEFLHRIFGKYFSDEVLTIILDKGEDELIGGDRRDMAVLFSDLRGFTSISENMSADRLTDLLNCYFGIMSKIIMQYSGTIIEYMGDGILAVFGAPVRSENYCADAIAAAITMQNAMSRVNAYCEEMGYGKLKMGIGIHCGEGFIGNVGSEDMMRYNVMGNVVNVCSRIESLSLGGQVMASKDIVKRAKVDIHVENDMYTHVKGVSDALNICSVTGIEGNYNVYISYTDMAKRYAVKEEIHADIYKIKNKLVEKEGIGVKLKEISTDTVVAEFTGKKEQIAPETYTDVEIIIKEDLSNKTYIKAYGKISGVSDNNIKITLTRATEDFESLIMRISLGKYGEISRWRPLMENNKIRVIETSLENIASEESLKNADEKYVLAFAQSGEDVKVAFYSNDSYIRALEFMDFLTGKYGTAKGDKGYAYAVIPKLFTDVMKNDMEAGNLSELFEKKAQEYMEECDCIFADEYIKTEKDSIERMQVYTKKPVPWAYVKTTDVIKAGEKFKLKSLENESNIVFSASEELYIMIGCRGEIYNISREKFVSTYNITNEPFDIFTLMPDFIPEIELYSDNTYISLDDKAYLCYPKDDKSIFAKKIDKRTKVYSTHNKGEYFVGRPGDFLALRTDDLSDVYIIKGDIFEQTYEAVK